MGEFSRAVAGAVKDALAAAGVSGSAVGRSLNRAQSYASLRINGRKAWTLDELDQIATLLDFDVDELMQRARRKL